MSEMPRANIDIEAYRKHGSSAWELPPWGHPISLGTYPLLVQHDNVLILTGTAFCIGGIGFLLTAVHNILSVCNLEGIPSPVVVGPFGPSKRPITLRQTQIFVMRHTVDETGGVTFTLQPLETVEAAVPTDLAIAFPRFAPGVPVLSHRVTFEFPRVGAKVRCVGYTADESGRSHFTLPESTAGSSGDKLQYGHSLRVVEGTVREVFVGRFAAGFVDGPCFSIEADVPHGLSGGPVFNEDGLVCGVVSAGAKSFFGAPRTLITPAYAVLTQDVRFGTNIGPIRMRSRQPVFELIASGHLLTDGTEKYIGITAIEDGYLVSPRVRSEDKQFVFEDFAGYQAGAVAKPGVPEGVRFFRRVSDAPADSM